MQREQQTENLKERKKNQISIDSNFGQGKTPAYWHELPMHEIML